MEKRSSVHEKIMFIMKISAIQTLLACLFFGFVNAGNGQEILDKKISVNIQKGSLRELLLQIEEKADVKFLFSSEIVPANDEVSIQATDERLARILDEILHVRKISYEVDGNQIILTKDVSKDQSSLFEVEKVLPLSAIVVGGRIVDEKEEPLPGVTILEKGTTNGTTSDNDGKYAITVAGSAAMLQFSYIGYATQEISVGNQTEVNVVLKPDIASLSEVVVVGYGTQKKADIIGSLSTIDLLEVNLKAQPNFDAGLQGLAAGVSVQSQGGAPGSGVTIKVRGTNSLNSSIDPLWIIDGNPVFANTSGLGTSSFNPMSLINQHDIASIQILKDAAATSIYGSRGSNGVVIVTTKRAKKGEANTTFSYSTGVSSLTRTPADIGYANTTQWFQIMDAAHQNVDQRNFTMADFKQTSPYGDTLTRALAQKVNTNWYNQIFRTGAFADYNLASSKGYENGGGYYISGNYRRDQGVQKDNNLDRFSIRSNVDLKPSEDFTVGVRLNFAYSNNNQVQSGTSKVVTYALPWFPVRQPNDPSVYFSQYASNPAATIDPSNYRNNVEQLRALGGFSLNYNAPFLKGLSLRTELSSDIIQSNVILWNSSNINLAAGVPTSYAREEAITFKGFNYNGYGTFDKTFNEHSLLVVTGVEATRSSQYTRILEGQNLTGTYPELGTPNTVISLFGGKQNERYLLGYFGRANYKFRNKYLLGLSARRDGSTVFSAANRWGNFFAASAGWILSDENFMSFLGQGVFLKLRGSYGETGNQNIPSGLNAPNYNQSLPYGTNPGSGTLPINVVVGDLKWESTKSSDVGIDFGFFNNRLNGSVAYYHRLVEHMLIPAPVPVSTGLTDPTLINYGDNVVSNSVWGNLGTMLNAGYELELHSTNIDYNGWRWTTDFNISFNKNLIKKLTPDVDATGKGIVGTTTVSRVGGRRREWFIADWAGVDPATGIPMIYALDQNKYSQTGATERLKNAEGKDSTIYATQNNIQGNRFYQKGKSADPKYYGGISNTVSFKGFDFGFMFAFSGGNYILDYDRIFATQPYDNREVLGSLLANSWQKPGDIAKYPQLRARADYGVAGTFGDNNVFHNRELYKGDYIRLRNVQIGYTLPKNVLRKIKMQGVHVYVSASNLWTKTKYPGFDPEGAGRVNPYSDGGTGLVYYSNGIPQLKSLNFGIDAKF